MNKTNYATRKTRQKKNGRKVSIKLRDRSLKKLNKSRNQLRHLLETGKHGKEVTDRLNRAISTIGDSIEQRKIELFDE